MARRIITPDNPAFLETQRDLEARATGEHRAPALMPELPYPAAPYGGAGAPSATWYVPVTAATFDHSQATQPWLARVARIVRTGFIVRVPWSTDAATTGEVRLYGDAGFPAGANNPTSAVALAANSSGIVDFRWLHGVDPWDATDAAIFIEARRTGGAGNVNIGYPLGGVIQADPRNCTPTGL